MATLEDLKKGAQVGGILPDQSVTIVDVNWYGNSCVELTYKDPRGRLGNSLLYRDDETRLKIERSGRSWSFDSDGEIFRLVSEAYRIRLAHLFDPHLAVHTSVLEPLPHQITAVYGEMLPRQPLRLLLADDPGSGKTIMAGLYIKELMVRGDVERCLIIAPGNLVDQWQDELWQRFQLDFKIISNQTIEDSRSGNPFNEYDLVLSRLDHLSRNEHILAKLEQTDWDLVVVDEAHKMSAHYFGYELKETKRYKLGKLVGAPERTRNFLLMTATPHNGKEEDFQLFLSLLDPDRFEGRYESSRHSRDSSDLMRRMVKEDLVRFDGTPLFPERRAYTVTYRLSEQEAHLYAEVTEYVRVEMNRAERLTAEGEGRRGNTVGFALTILQRRLASSPEAIYQSLRRRRERLESRVTEEKLLKRGFEYGKILELSEEEIEDLEDAPEGEVENLEEEIIEQASAARTIEELEAEIAILERLENLANDVRHSGKDRKWEELSNLLQDTPEMFDESRHRRKMIIFTEHRDTLQYLCRRIRTLLGRAEAVVHIDGSMRREERRYVQELFSQDPGVEILVATDAAGEGINLQRAHLMANYDLPWNPNRLEQRFGRIHRIGQTEVCHMWSLVAEETREGDVFKRLLKKLEVESQSLDGRVFDVLGQVFEGTQLRKLLIEAIRYGDRPEVRERLNQVVDSALDPERLKKLLEEEALTRDLMDAARVSEVREEMERAAARRLQPHFIRAFFLEAFRRLGGSIRERESKRFEITYVPASIRNRARQLGRGEVLTRYERICFDKDQMRLTGRPGATLVCPGHPLLDSIVDLILERFGEFLKKGTVLVDEESDLESVRALFYLEHAIQDARTTASGGRRIISQQMQFVEIDSEGNMRIAGHAPYLNYRPILKDELVLVRPHLEAEWLSRDLDVEVRRFAAEEVVPRHLSEVRNRKEAIIKKTQQAVRDRLLEEIRFWDTRAIQLRREEEAGKKNAGVNAARARQRADELETRLRRRMDELEKERQISALPPNILGGCLIVPGAQLMKLKGETTSHLQEFNREKKAMERLAMQMVMEVEAKMGFQPRDVSSEDLGYDIESKDPVSGRLRFIEVKGRVEGARTVTVTKNEILTALNKPDDFILAIGRPGSDGERHLHYILRPFQREPDFAVTSVNYDLERLLERSVEPEETKTGVAIFS